MAARNAASGSSGRGNVVTDGPEVSLAGSGSACAALVTPATSSDAATVSTVANASCRLGGRLANILLPDFCTDDLDRGCDWNGQITFTFIKIV
jgi:hypothetical protein